MALTAYRRGTWRFRFASFVRKHRLAPLVLLAPVIAFLMAMLVLPLASIVELSLYRRGEAGNVIEIAGWQNYATFLGEYVYRHMLTYSALVGVIVCILTIVAAYIPAAVLGLTRSRFKNVLFIMILVPFWTSFIVRTYAWIILLSTKGVVNSALEGASITSSALPLLYSRETVVVGLIHALLPFAIVPIYACIERVDSSVLEAAVTLGAKPARVFAEIIVPLSLPGLLAAGLLVFIEAMGAFITPQLLGSSSDMMIAQLIQKRFIRAFDWPLGSAVAMIYLAFTGGSSVSCFSCAVLPKDMSGEYLSLQSRHKNVPLCRDRSGLCVHLRADRLCCLRLLRSA